MEDAGRLMPGGTDARKPEHNDADGNANGDADGAPSRGAAARSPSASRGSCPAGLITEQRPIGLAHATVE